MNTAVLIKSDDWEGLFINGTLIQEGHTLNEGMSRVKYFNDLSKQYNFSLDDLKEGYVTEEYESILYDTGCFDSNLNDVNYNLCE